jgi:hypothetical protein
MTGVRVVGLERRLEGGRAYKAVLPFGDFYVDLREDVLLDTLLTVGVEPGGVLNGEYVFGKVRSQMKLVRVGSDLHEVLYESMRRAEMKPIGKDDITYGGVYETKSGTKYLCCGMVSTVEYKCPTIDTLKRKPAKKAFLVLELQGKDWASASSMETRNLTPVEELTKALKPSVYWYGRVELKVDPKLLFKTDSVEMPYTEAKLVEKLREKARNDLDASRGHGLHEKKLSAASGFANMVVFGETVEEDERYRRYS